MKQFLFALFSLFFISTIQAQNVPGNQLSHHIADKMKDTLDLSNQQRAEVFQINKDLTDKKDKARKKSNDRAIVGPDIQGVERTRDSLYKEVLTVPQYILYLEKKRNLVTAN
jgi:hypothetical protein